MEGLGDDNSSGESGDDDQVMSELEVQTCYLHISSWRVVDEWRPHSILECQSFLLPDTKM